MSVILEVKDLAISFGGIKAVKNANFVLNQGEILGLIGPNGSGKSTCVNMISGVYHQDRGQILYRGRELTAKDTIADRAKMGITRTFQTPKPFGHLSVYQNIYTIALQRYSPKDAAAKTEEILEMTKLAPLASMRSIKLPIEKRKWLDLARILTLDPKIIMMDEVMGGLNPSEMQESLQLVKKINKEGISVLFIEHVMKAVVEVCHRVVVLADGNMLSEGAPEEVLKRPEVIEAYLGGGQKKNAAG